MNGFLLSTGWGEDFTQPQQRLEYNPRQALCVRLVFGADPGDPKIRNLDLRAARSEHI